MRRASLYLCSLSVVSTFCSGLSLENTSASNTRPCVSSPSELSSDNQKCPQTFTYNQDIDMLFGGETSINYFLSKTNTLEKASMVAHYSRDGLSGRLIGTYKNNLTDRLIGSTSDAKLNVAYEAKLADTLKTIASETIFISEQDNIPIVYTSSVEAKYKLYEDFHLYTQGIYSYLQERSEILSPLDNPYSTSIGIDHANDSKSFIRALYTQSKEQDPFLKPSKAIKLVAKRKIGKKLNTILTIKKHIEPSLQEDKGILDLSYSF